MAIIAFNVNGSKFQEIYVTAQWESLNCRFYVAHGFVGHTNHARKKLVRGRYEKQLKKPA